MTNLADNLFDHCKTANNIVPGLDQPCLLWSKSTNQYGYGRVQHSGRLWSTHRLAWCLSRGLKEVPYDCQVLHRCDTPPCIQPSHLMLGDISMNMRDMMHKSRSSHSASYEKVEAVRAAHRNEQVTQKELAERFGLSVYQVHRIVRGKTFNYRSHGVIG